nr:DUF1501 domain-containing protein [Streptacidiphilus melanogenes]
MEPLRRARTGPGRRDGPSPGRLRPRARPHRAAARPAARPGLPRPVQANANQGTDHGTAAPLFVAGTPVRGGFHGAQPSLTDLDAGDLRFTTDFRSVYATLLHQVLGADPKQVLGQDFPELGFV